MGEENTTQSTLDVFYKNEVWVASDGQICGARCPVCDSKESRYRKTSGDWLCLDCRARFEKELPEELEEKIKPRKSRAIVKRDKAVEPVIDGWQNEDGVMKPVVVGSTRPKRGDDRPRRKVPSSVGIKKEKFYEKDPDDRRVKEYLEKAREMLKEIKSEGTPPKGKPPTAVDHLRSKNRKKKDRKIRRDIRTGYK